ncbi:carboxypeptidase-like regulatory domain-containing protein [Capnocytophaga cynodegmi]|uniref:carboxypeptidase-like regulatory domain-containing protein n=1 Tax=Capnocytophaga cynodegmi TaxID=28189 RepID=UPI00385E1310
MSKILKKYKSGIIGLGFSGTAQDLHPKAVSECESTKKNNVMTGKIFDDEKLPLPGVHVINRTKRTGTTTGDNGAYKLETQPNDDIEISHIGFKTVKAKAKDVPSLIYMIEEVMELEGVTVTPKKKVLVKPSLNQKISKNKNWIWIAVAGLVLFGGYHYFKK